MVVFFLPLAAFRSSSLPHPIFRGNCEATIGTWHYNLRLFQDRNRDLISVGLARYLARICPTDTTGPLDDVFLMKYIGFIGWDVVTRNSIDWRPLDQSNASAGVICFASGEPYEAPDGSYRTLDLEWWISCGTNPHKNATAEFIIDDNGTTGLFIGRLSSAAGCPRPTSSPTPTPAYAPQCRFTRRSDADRAVGVQLDLADLNGGPFGVKVPISVDGEALTLYFQACGRMDCPPAYACAPAELSSAWLCADGAGSCRSWGVGAERPDVHAPAGNASRGVVLRLNESSEGYAVELALRCRDGEWPRGHIAWDGAATASGRRLAISGAAKEACLVPIVAPPNKTCAFATESGGRSVRLDLHSLNRPGAGWETVVRVDGQGRSARLRYEPCGSLHCPVGAHCQGIEDAAVWLCANESDIELCTAFGLIEDDVQMALADPGHIEKGVKVAYIGDMRHEAVATFVCAEEELALPEVVTIDERRLQFVVKSRATCAIGGGVRWASVGAIFLTLVVLLFTVYFAAGVLITLFTKGVPGIPNVQFWREIYDLITEAVSAIFVCSRKPISESDEKSQGILKN
jgi:hypothetical protein